MQRITMEDVAREAGVSRALVSRAMLGRPGVSKRAGEAIAAAAEKLGYRHNTIAARLAAQRTNTIGLFLRDIYNEVWADVYTGLRLPAERAGLDVVLSIGLPDGATDAHYVDSLLRMRVDAAIVAGTLLPDDELHRLAQAAPIVSVARLVPRLSSVATDDYAGGRIAAEHLMRLGHRDIVVLAPEFKVIISERERGTVETIRAGGGRARVVRSNSTQEDATREALRVLTAEPERPSAVIANNDVIALGVLEAAARAGLSVPRELSVVGYDDIRISAHPRVSLTTVNQHALRMGELAFELALEQREDPDGDVVHRLLDPALVVRDSTAPPPP